MERLSVWFHGILVGSIDFDARTNSFVFGYADSYLQQPHAVAISASLPLFGAASTDILKPASPRLPESVFNELYCQRLASECGVGAAECGVVRFGSETCYRTVRYDRYEAGGRVRRWHQEDFCQVLCLEPEQKYQDEGGPSVARCEHAIRSLRMGFVHSCYRQSRRCLATQ